MNWMIEGLSDTTRAGVWGGTMVQKRGVALPWLLLLVYFQLSSAGHHAEYIKEQQKLIETSILEDFKKIKENFNATVDAINKAMTGLKKFTDDSIQDRYGGERCCSGQELRNS